jgi:hypothetical protein
MPLRTSLPGIALIAAASFFLSTSEAQYQPRSFKGATDDELYRFMGHGKSAFAAERERLIANQLPDGFWSMDAKAAVLPLVEANRTKEHRAAFKLSLDQRNAGQPLSTCAIAFTDSSARCYNAVDAHYFLHVAPENSYLAYARSWAGGVVFYNVVHDQPAFDFRLCPLSYQDARKIAEVAWWLDRVRSKEVKSENGFGIGSSTADGRGSLALNIEGQSVIERSGTLWSDYLSERWKTVFDREAFLNFAGYLIGQVLPEKLGKAWTQFEPKHSQDIQSAASRSADKEV